MAFSPELDVRRAMATGKACLSGKPAYRESLPVREDG